MFADAADGAVVAAIVARGSNKMFTFVYYIMH